MIEPALAAIGPLAGESLPIGIRPYYEYASIDSFRNFAIGYGDGNPLFADEAYGAASRWGSVIAPPLYPIAAGVAIEPPPAVGDALRAALRGLPVSVGEDRWELRDVIRPGVRLLRRDELARAAIVGDLLLITTRSTYIEGGTVYAVHDRTRTYGGAGIDHHDGSRIAKHTYTVDEIEAFDRQLASYRRRGAARGEARVGAHIGPLLKGPLTTTDLVAYRGGVGPGPFGVEPLALAYVNRQRRPDFYDRDGSNAWDARERLHWDDSYAQRCGHPAAYDYSHTRLNWAVQLFTDWVGDNGRLLAITFEHLAHNYVGDTHWMSGTVTSVEHDRAEARFEGTNQLGDVTCRGTATIELGATN